MGIKEKLIKLESADSRYLTLSILLLFNFIQFGNARADDYIGSQYAYLIYIVILIALLIFFVFIDRTVKNKERYLILKDGTLFLPNAFTKKIKTIELSDIVNISLEGFFQNKIKINMINNNQDYFFAPRIFDTYDKDIKDIYNTLNKLLVENY
ncbi:MAG: hypothetical protein QM489_06300 [Candidatus Izemoplasma sp.]